MLSGVIFRQVITTLSQALYITPSGLGAAVCHIRKAIKDALEITNIPWADGNTLHLEDL